MKSLLAIYASGVLFAIGLGVAGMTDANTVLAFLDLAGGWDPSLGFVMIGAISVHALLYPRILGGTPLFSQEFSLPTRSDINARLIGGAALFGIGWGLGGYCPGPAIVSLVTFTHEALVFVGAMIVGMGLFQALSPEPEG